MIIFKLCVNILTIYRYFCINDILPYEFLILVICIPLKDQIIKATLYLVFQCLVVEYDLPITNNIFIMW